MSPREVDHSLSLGVFVESKEMQRRTLREPVSLMRSVGEKGKRRFGEDVHRLSAMIVVRSGKVLAHH